MNYNDLGTSKKKFVVNYLPMRSKPMSAFFSSHSYHFFKTAYSGGDKAPICFPISRKQNLEQDKMNELI